MTIFISFLPLIISAISLVISLLSFRGRKRAAVESRLIRYREELQAVLISFQREQLSRARCQRLLTEAKILRESLKPLLNLEPYGEISKNLERIAELQGNLNDIESSQEENLQTIQQLWGLSNPDHEDLGNLQNMAVIQQRLISTHEDSASVLESLVEVLRQGRALGTTGSIRHG